MPTTLRMRRAAILAGLTASASVLGFVPGAQADLRVGKNYRLNADTSPFRAKDQIALAVNPGNPQHVVAVNADYLSQDCEHSVSIDGGATWTTAVPFTTRPGYKPTCRIAEQRADSTYQTVAFGRGENVYVAFATPKIAGGGEEGASVLVARSVDGGRTFATPVVAMQAGVTSAAGPNFELPTIAVDLGTPNTVDPPPAPAPPPPPGPTGPPVTPPGPSTIAGCGPGRTVIRLGAGDDVRNGTSGRDLIFAGAGNDQINARAGDDCVDLGIGNDRGRGEAGDDLIVGGAGNDTATGAAGKDVLNGGTGADRLDGDAGNDRLNGDAGLDRLNGGASNDVISGGSGADRIAGGAGNDRLTGGSGRDRISGSSGTDRISARDSVRDTISCGRGRDTVTADRIDSVARDCERVTRARARSARSASLPASVRAWEAAAGTPAAATLRAPSTRAAGRPERVYVVANETTAALGAAHDVVSAVSGDGALNFSAAVVVEPAGENATEASQPVVGPDGSVYVAWREVGVEQPAGQPGPGVERPVKVARSINNGQTWLPPVITAMVTAGGIAANSHTTPQISAASTFPRLAVDTSNGTLYLVFGQGPPGPTPPPGRFGSEGGDRFIHHDSDVYFQRSVDGGATWTGAKRINDATVRPGSEVTQTRHPNVSVAPNGRVDVVWQDRRHWYQPPDGERRCIHVHLSCSEPRLGDTYYAYSSNAGSTFSENRRVTDQSHNNDVGYDSRYGTYAAFGPVAVPLGNTQLLVGWMDSRLGNPDNDNQDIFLAKVDHGAAGPAPEDNLTAQPSALSVALSQLAYPGGGEATMASLFATRPWTRPVIVNEADAPSMMAGGVLARANLGPVLLAPQAGLPGAVLGEVARLRPVGAYVLGDATRLSPAVEAQLAAAGVPAGQIVRISGGTPADVAAAIAVNHLDRRRVVEKTADVPAFDAVVIANPNSAGAYVASGLAAARRLPVLWVDQNAIPAVVTAALATLDINKTLVIGSSGVISNTVMAQLPNPTRLSTGPNQYATSSAVVAESKARGMPDNIAYVTNGNTPSGGALLGSTVARLGGMMFYSPSNSTPAATAGTLGLAALDRLIVAQCQACAVVANDP